MPQVTRGSIYLVVVLGVIGWPPTKALSAEVTLGSTNDSTLNSAPAIQAALDAVEARGGGIVRLTGGKYYIGNGLSGEQGIRIGNNTHLLLDHDAVIIRNFRSGGDGGATIRNKNQDATGNVHIRVSGGTIKSEDLTLEGHHLGFQNVDWLTISDIEFRGVRDWNVSLRGCDDVIVSKLLIKSGTMVNSAGVQVSGGARIVIADCDITCGDDSIALVCDTIAGAGNISDVAISNCYLHSLEANALKILVEKNVAFVITRVTVSNIVAKAGQPNSTSSTGIMIVDQNLLKRVVDVEIDGFWLDASENFGDVMSIDGVRRVRLARVVLKNPKQRARISNSDDVALIDCIIDTPQTNGQPCLIVAQPLPATPPVDGTSHDIRILGGEYRGAKQHAIQMGTAEFPVIGFEISHVQIGPAVNNGIYILNSSNGIVIGNRVTGCSVWGIQEFGPLMNDNWILGNWLKGNTVGALSLVGPRTEAVRNLVAPGAALPDTGGFRQTIDGWVFPSIGATQAITDITRATGRFRGAARLDHRSRRHHFPAADWDQRHTEGHRVQEHGERRSSRLDHGLFCRD